MGAERNLNPDQLRMFMTPTEIKDEFYPLSGDKWEGETDDEFWSRVGKDNHSRAWDRGPAAAPLADVNLSTVTNPVRLVHPGLYGSKVIGNGHHRVAAGVEDESEGTEVYLPVLHYEHRLQAINDGQYPDYGRYDATGKKIRGER